MSSGTLTALNGRIGQVVFVEGSHVEMRLKDYRVAGGFPYPSGRP